MAARGVTSWPRRCPFCGRVVRITNFMRLRHPHKTEGKRPVWYTVVGPDGANLWIDNTHFDACFRERGEAAGYRRIG